MATEGSQFSLGSSSLTAGSGRVSVAWVKTAWLYVNLTLGLVALPKGLSPWSFVLGFVLSFLTLCVGHSIGLHRGIIHKTYRTSRFVRRLFSLLFVFSGLGGPLSWIMVHYTRDQWQNRDDAPRFFRYDHGIVVDFHWNLHCRFVPSEPGVYGVPAEDAGDPFLRFLERTWIVFPLALALLIGWQLGWAVMGVTCALRVAAGILGHWFVGYVSHKIGYVRYALDGASAEGRNVFFLGVISFGEGFHNNHHAYPGSARMGVKWYEFDLGWWVVRTLELAGVVHDVAAWHRPGFHVKASANAVDPRFIFRNPNQSVRQRNAKEEG